jgi:hypothetical protein
VEHQLWSRLGENLLKACLVPNVGDDDLVGVQDAWTDEFEMQRVKVGLVVIEKVQRGRLEPPDLAAQLGPPAPVTSTRLPRTTPRTRRESTCTSSRPRSWSTCNPRTSERRRSRSTAARKEGRWRTMSPVDEASSISAAMRAAGSDGMAIRTVRAFDIRAWTVKSAKRPSTGSPLTRRSLGLSSRKATGSNP